APPRQRPHLRLPLRDREDARRIGQAHVRRRRPQGAAAADLPDERHAVPRLLGGPYARRRLPPRAAPLEPRDQARRCGERGERIVKWAESWEPYAGGQRAGVGALIDEALGKKLRNYKRQVAKRYRVVEPEQIERLLSGGPYWISTKLDG